MPITDWPVAERPREKLLERGPEALSDAELLAIFLRTGTAGHSALDLARQMLTHYPNLSTLLNADALALCKLSGMGPAKYAQLQAALELGKRYLYSEIKSQPKLSNPEQTRQYLTAKLRGYPYEVFAIVYLDNQHQVLGYEELFRGTINEACIYPREVVTQCLKKQAAAIIFAHNHPSGLAEPSKADQAITARLQQALSLIDIQVLDHLIIAGSRWVSMAQRGLLEPST